MEITGGSPERTYVKGETLLATSARLGMLPNHCTAYVFIFSPSSRSATSVIPYQSTTAATFNCSVPGHCRSSPTDAGIIAVVSARCPPAEPPEATSLFVSKPYCFALRLYIRMPLLPADYCQLERPFDLERTRPELVWKSDIWFGDKALGLKSTVADVIRYCQLGKMASRIQNARIRRRPFQMLSLAQTLSRFIPNTNGC